MTPLCVLIPFFLFTKESRLLWFIGSGEGSLIDCGSCGKGRVMGWVSNYFFFIISSVCEG